MIIQRITITNFQCYYQSNEFNFDKGLNIILGSNSHGKSKLFDALYWLFTEKFIDEKYNQKSLISAKALKNLSDFEVGVNIQLEKSGEIFNFERKFKVEVDNGEVECSKTIFEANTLNVHGERTPQGHELLDQIFPPAILRYCLFKGERSLNIFDPNNNPDALINLVNNLTRFKSYDEFVEVAQILLSSSIKAIDRTSRRNAKEKKNRDDKIARRDSLTRDIAILERSIKESKNNHHKASSLREEILGQFEVGDQIKTINARIRELEKEISGLEGLIETRSNFTVQLFDDYWILKGYKKTQKKFEEKYKKFEKDRRKVSEEHAKQQGKKELLSHLTDTPLPIGVPAKEHLEEMLDEEMCKVCNRDAKKGSEAYIYMEKRLNEFLGSLDPEIMTESEDPFKNEFVDELNDANRLLLKKIPFIETINATIKDNLDFINARRLDKEGLNERLRKEEMDREKLLSESSSSEQTLIDIPQKIRGYDADISRYDRDIVSAENELIEKRRELGDEEKELRKMNVEDVPSFLMEKEEIARDIEIIVSETKQSKLDEVLNEIENRANHYYKEMGRASGGYTGRIELIKDSADNVRIYTVDKNRNTNAVNALSSSTSTSLYLSILLAISSLASEKLNESFPVVFDAPTSEFDEDRAFEFLNQSKTNFNQCIILAKNFLEEGGTISKKLNELGPNVAYRIKLDEGIDPEAIETVETKTQKII